MRRKIAFFRVWRRHPVDRQVEAMLRAAFPEFDLATITLMDALRRERGVLLRNALATVRHYGVGLALRRRRWRESFLRTPYLFHWARGYARHRLEREAEYAFSFQLQSLFETRWPGLPHFIYTDHTHLENLNYPDYPSTRLAVPAWIALERALYQGATRVFTRSSNISRSLVEQYGCERDRVICVYAGGNIAAGSAPPENDGYRNGVILFVGTDWERKGGPELVRAFEQVRRRFPNARLQVVGCSPALNAPGVEVIGRLPLETMPQYYLRASVYCLPTRVEPFGATIVEAMACRLPVVATAVGAVPDMVEHDRTGYLVSPGDSKGLAAALERLLASPETCRQFGEAGYRLVMDRYRWERVGERIRRHVLSALREG